MHTRASRPALWKTTPRGLVLLSTFAASVALAQDATTPPPGPPTYAADVPADPAAGTFRFDGATSGWIYFNPVAGATGYRLYLGTAARTAGAPYSFGRTPCDLGNPVDPGNAARRRADVDGCLNAGESLATQNLFVAVTAYNSFGNEGEYSAQGYFIPVTAPSGATSSTAGGANGAAKTVTLSWTRGTAPAGATVQTEVFRRVGTTGAYTKIATVATASTYTDSDATLDKDTAYEYLLRSVATSANGGPATYSASVTRSQTTNPDTYTETIAGSQISPRLIANLDPGDVVRVDQISGTVNFNTSGTCNSSEYTVNANGLARSTYTGNPFCYGTDLNCGDPVGGSAPHAALYLRHGGTTTLVGTGGANFTVGGSAESLTMFVNDCAATPNGGGFGVRVTVSR